MRLIPAVVLLSVSALALGQDEPEECAQVNRVEFPTADLPSPAVSAALAKCDSVDLYYGLTQPADPSKARKCAYLAIDEKGNGPALEDAAILMMVYANGKGAARNFDVALKLACIFEGAPAELFGRVQHLVRLREEHWTGDSFSVCDDITSGRMHGWCAGFYERITSAKRAGRLNIITSRWSSEEQRAFRLLEREAERFFTTRSQEEVDLSGTSRAAFQIEEEASLRDGFLSALEAFEQGQLPRFSPDEFSEADAELNSVYRRIQNTSGWNYGTVTQQGIRNTERAWIRYRDAWVAFGRKKYPAVAAESWKTRLTRERVKMLADFLQ